MRKILLFIAVISLSQFSFGQKLSVRELSDKDRESKISKDDYIKYKDDSFYQKPDVGNNVESISEKGSRNI